MVTDRLSCETGRQNQAQLREFTKTAKCSQPLIGVTCVLCGKVHLYMDPHRRREFRVLDLRR